MGGHRCRSFLHARDEIYAPHAIAECATTLSHRRSQICDTSAQFLCTRPQARFSSGPVSSSTGAQGEPDFPGACFFIFS